jgi:glycosyltransferase involved in cell wall biosynthesis
VTAHDDRPRLLFVVSDLETGIGVSLLRLLERIHDHYRVLVCELSSAGTANKDAARGLGAEIVQLGKLGVNPTVFLDLLRVARRFRPQIVHGFQLETNFHGCLVGRLVGARVVASFHGMVTAFRPSKIAFLYVILLTAHRVVCVSTAIARLCLRRLPSISRRLAVIPNGVGDEFFPAASRKADTQLTLTYVADFHSPYKGHADLLRAFRLLPSEGFALWLVGDGLLLPETKARAQTLAVEERVTFWGRRHDVPELLRNTDVFVLPSLSEGSPLALLEAMATGLPIVATAIDGVREIAEDRKTALLVPPGDAVRLRDAILELAGDAGLRARLGRNALTEARSAFRVEATTRRYVQLYEDLLARS